MDALFVTGQCALDLPGLCVPDQSAFFPTGCKGQSAVIGKDNGTGIVVQPFEIGYLPGGLEVPDDDFRIFPVSGQRQQTSIGAGTFEVNKFVRDGLDFIPVMEHIPNRIPFAVVIDQSIIGYESIKLAIEATPTLVEGKGSLKLAVLQIVYF